MSLKRHQLLFKNGLNKAEISEKHYDSCESQFGRSSSGDLIHQIVNVVSLDSLMYILSFGPV